MAKRLDSAVPVRNVKTPGRRPAGDTLYLMVWPSARKSWVQRLTIEGKRKDLGLGPYPTVSLAQARKRALDNLSLVKPGGNPLAEKQEESKLSAVPTFEALARQHIAENLGSWRSSKHGAQWGLNPCDLCVPDARRLASERDHPPSRGGRALPHLDLQAGDRTARCWPSSTTSGRSPAATSLHLFWMCCPQAQPDHIARMTLLHHLTGRDPLLSAPFCE